MHPLDRPVWASLSTFHAGLSAGNPLARRYLPEINLFASARDATAEAEAAIAALVRPGERIYELQVPSIATPPGLVKIKSARGVQMVATRSQRAQEARQVISELTDADAAEMLALATLTEPGPFLARTHKMGRFLGVRIGGRLVAMAGERFRFPGYTEVSGVCTHPEFRGQGLARSLSAAVARNVESRGDQPFLHAWKTNHKAIALYESLGFKVRTEVDVAVLERASSGGTPSVV